MAHTQIPDLARWEQFQQAARERKQNPVTLLEDYIQECLETWADQRLDLEIQQDLQRSGHQEDEAVELVRNYRLERRAAS
jgi:hypothetical protein